MRPLAAPRPLPAQTPLRRRRSPTRPACRRTPGLRSPLPGRLTGAAATLCATLCATLLPLHPGSASGQSIPPDEDWRQFATEHFVVTHPASLSAFGARAGVLAESAWDLLAGHFADVPSTPVHLLITDHADIANGFATPTPFNRITIFARPPVAGGSISYFDEWLELVILHELVHTFHLDMTGAVGRVVRRLFGRLPTHWPNFPSAASPTWFLEGLAVWFESRYTGAGRVRGSWQEMVLRMAALEGEFAAAERVEGASPVWPGGHRPYVYGARYLAHMAEQHGEEALIGMAEAVAGAPIPYRMNAAARTAFGVGVDESWQRWGDSLAAGARAEADALAERVPLTVGEEVAGAGRQAEQAMISPDGARLAWMRADGTSTPQIRTADPDGGRAGRLTRLNTLGGSLSWAPDGDLVFTQLDFTDRYRLHGDLYRVEPAGRVRRLTRGARIGHADVSPDGMRAVAVREGGGTNALVMIDLETGAATPWIEAAADRHWAFPRWSPDGTRVAAVRWEAPAQMNIVVLDGEQGEVVAEITRDRAVDTTPFWSPDGRWLLWSSDRTGIPNLFAVSLVGREVGEVRQVTNMLGGASHPSVDPQLRWIHFSSYHADGWHIERIPWDPDSWFAPQPTLPRFLGSGGRPATADLLPHPTPDIADTLAAGPYRPFATLRPWYWRPLLHTAERGTDRASRLHTVLNSQVGFALAGTDLVGRHSWSLAARIAPAGGRFTGSLGYSFRGLGNPVLGTALAQSWDASSRTIIPGGSTDEFFLVERERSAALSASFLRQRYRSALSLGLRGALVQEEIAIQHPNGDAGPRLRDPSTTFVDARATLAASNTRRHAFSISREDGVRGWASARMRRERGVASVGRGRVGMDRSFSELTGEVAAFGSPGRIGFANHVLALRISGGIAFGPGADRFHFDLGDAAGRSELATGLGLFGGAPRLFPLRGYRDNYRSGRIAWSASAEYRFPIALLDSPLPLLPLSLDRLYGSLFFDAGNAWGPTRAEPQYDNPRRGTLTSLGGELTLIVAPFYQRGIDLRFGTGVPLAGGDPVFYLRVGNAF